VLEIGGRLDGVPLLCQIPWWERDQFVGVIDVIDRVGWRWPADKLKTRYELGAITHKQLQDEVEVAREKLVETLAEFDEEVMEMFAEDPKQLSSEILKKSIRRALATGDGSLIPVFAGASFRNIGVEPLMDAIVEYLPNPRERPDVEVQTPSGKQSLSKLIANNLDKHTGMSRIAAVASVFKVFNHPKEGMLSYVRVYHGELHKGSHTWNTHILAQERPLSLLQVSADRTQDITHLGTGQIGAIKGLKKARTGDTLLTTVAHKSVPESLQHIQIRPPDIPPAVAFLAIDPYSLTATKALREALEIESREDPSLRWIWEDKADQFILQGMGQLHLEIAVRNLKQKYVIDADFGQIEVDYKECVTAPTGPHHVVYDSMVAGKGGMVAVTATLEPLEEHHSQNPAEPSFERDGNILHVQMPSGVNIPGINLADAQQQLLNGAISALARGPRLGRPIQRCHVSISLDPNMTHPAGGHFSNAAQRAVRDALKDASAKAQVSVLEPVMKVHITCPEESAGAVQHDITSAAGGHIHEINDLSTQIMGSSDPRSDSSASKVILQSIYCPPDPYEMTTSLRDKKKSVARMVEIVARVPYKEMLDYDNHLRGKTGGRHSVTMAFDCFERVVGARDKAL
jgi:elongation factor G